MQTMRNALERKSKLTNKESETEDQRLWDKGNNATKYK